MPKYRFFYHYYRAKGRMTVHWRGRCLSVDHVRCCVPTETHYRVTQPRLVIRGWATKVSVKGMIATIT